jgi:serine/threonine protein kinase
VYQSNGKIKTIGSGSYGQVYLGMNIIDKKYYAIKHMDKKNIFTILNSLLNIQKEIDIQSKIDHPNIVKLLYVKETHISYDLVMEYASMGSLFHYIRKYKGLNENKTFSLFIQVVNAVNFMHSNDLIHRDIKPENILIFENNIIRLCDFGWCVKLDGHQRGTFCGTTEYMSPELVNHQGYGKEIDVWSLGILLYEMIHGYSPFRPNKPKFNEKDVMENIKNHNLIFGKTVSDECKQLIYHLLDPDINKRYNVEDIYNSAFVKKYEKLNYSYPDANLVQHYNKKIKETKEQNVNNTIKIDENIDINNIINPKFEINKNINSFNNNNNNILYLNNNYQIPESRNIYNIYPNFNQKFKNLTSYDLNREIYFESITNNGDLYEQNTSNNKYSNNMNMDLLFENNNQKNEISNIYNNEKQNINLFYLDNSERHPQDGNKKYIKELNNYNNESYLLFTGNNKNNSINLTNNDINYLNKINNSNMSQINNQYIQINQNNIQNIPSINTSDNKSVNYNYFYNFNNYNNNYTNNYYNNNCSQISPNNFPKKILISNYNINSENSNLSNSNINIILDKSKTASTIPTTSNKINLENKDIIIRQKKISEFEIGEEKYNLSDKEQNENEYSAIKINMNHEHQKINNRKYLSRSDYSSINKKKKEEKVKNIFIKKLDIGEIKIDNINQLNNSERINEQKDEISNVEKVEQYLLKNKIYKTRRENNYKLLANISEPNLNQNEINNKRSIKIINSNFPSKQKLSRFLSEKNVIDKNGKEKNAIEKINRTKKGYNKNLRNKIINKDNNPIKKKSDSTKNENYIGDLLCSLFNVFDSKKDKKNEVNIMKKENNKYSNNTQKSVISRLQDKERQNKTNNINYTNNSSFIKIEKNNRRLNKNSSFIRINKNKNKLINLDISKFENGPSNNNKNKIKKIAETQPNLENKENNNLNIINNKNNNKILKHHVSSNDIIMKKNNEIKHDNKNKIIEIPINSKNINILYKNKKSFDEYTNLNNSQIITPKKRYIFNRIHPFKLLGAFKKELTNFTNYSHQNSKLN